MCSNINASISITNRWTNKLRKLTVCSSVAHIYRNDLSDLPEVLVTSAENINSSQNEALSCCHSSRHFFLHPKGKKMHLIYFLYGNMCQSSVLKKFFTPCYFRIHCTAQCLLKFWLLHQSTVFVICYLPNILLINSWFLYSHYRF